MWVLMAILPYSADWSVLCSGFHSRAACDQGEATIWDPRGSTSVSKGSILRAQGQFPEMHGLSSLAILRTSMLFFCTTILAPIESFQEEHLLVGRRSFGHCLKQSSNDTTTNAQRRHPQNPTSRPRAAFLSNAPARGWQAYNKTR